MTVGSVDFDRSVIYVRKTLQNIKGKGIVIGEPKSESSRWPVAMLDFVKQALLEHLQKRTFESEYIFCASNGTPFSPRNVVRHFKKTLKKAGLPENTRIHDLRHFFVSWLLSQNTPPKDVQAIVGNADIDTTMNINGHMMPGADREAAGKMDKFFYS